MKPETVRKIIDVDSRMIQFLNYQQYAFLGSDLKNVIRFIYVLRNSPTKKISSFNKEDADFAITNQERINAVKNAVWQFINYAKLNAYYYDDANYSIRPFISIAYHLFYKDVEISDIAYYWNNNPEEFVLFKTWLYYSLLFDKFREEKNVFSPSEDLLEIFTFHKSRKSLVFSADELDKFNKEFVLFLLSGRRSGLNYQHIEVVGHLMSPFFLKQYNYSDESINNIRNLGIFESRHLRIKDSLSFREWMRLCISNHRCYSNTPVVPDNEELWSEDRFLEFCEARGRLIIDKINQIFSNLETEYH